MRLILLFAVFVVVGLAFESAGARIVTFRSLIPNLIIILAVDLGLRHHGVMPAILAFAMGYATDALAGSHPGLNAFMTTMVFLVSYEISTRLMVANAFVGATVVFFGVIATALGTIAIANGFNALSDTGPLMPALTLQAFITALIAPIIFSMLALSKRLTGLPDGSGRDARGRDR
ncbi:MAG: rod shape-determining protein MreD [Candidatus Binatus sp.]|uniref:rod shape-determining protein MreD n=1 Tax=Candidatus Binatus sp. TaxID=2811406 RepID=UPI003C79115F